MENQEWIRCPACGEMCQPADPCCTLGDIVNRAKARAVPAMICRYCDHTREQHADYAGRECQPCDVPGCTCYGFNLDVPAGRRRALSAGGGKP